MPYFRFNKVITNILLILLFAVGFTSHSATALNADFDTFHVQSTNTRDFTGYATDNYQFDSQERPYGVSRDSITLDGESEALACLVNQTKVFDKPVDLSNLVVAFDQTHGATTAFHNAATFLQANLTSSGATFYNIAGSFVIPADANVLLFPNSNTVFTALELNEIWNWYYEPGPHLIWVAGDSDYDGAYIPTASNDILERIGANLRISADTIEDAVYNDGAYYRVGVQAQSDGMLNSLLTHNVSVALMHGPTSILGYQNNAVVDLGMNSIAGVDVILRSSPNSVTKNLDGSTSEFDYYPTNNINGNSPMMAIQDMGDEKYAIASGEAIFSDYKKMYDLFTENGTLNGGIHDGKHLVDNIMIWFESLINTPHGPVLITDDSDFSAQGFDGAGTVDDPYLIAGLDIAIGSGNLIEIWNTTANFCVRDNTLNGFTTSGHGIFVVNGTQGIIERNQVLNIGNNGIRVDNSTVMSIKDNYVHTTVGSGIVLAFNSIDITISGNEIASSEFNGINVVLGSSNVTITDNNIHDNVLDGIHFEESHFNFIENNHFSNCNTGILLLNSSSNEILGNTVMQSVNGGIALQAASNYNLVSNNTSFNNGLSGIYVGSSSDNVISTNQVYANGHSGIYLFLSTQNQVVENFAFSNSVKGVGLETSTANELIGNTVYDNQDAGIGFILSPGNFIIDNEVYNNKLNGIAFFQSTDNRITNNNVYGNIYRGIRIQDGSNGNIIELNKIHDNTEDGIVIWTSDNIVDNNEYYSNTWSGIRLDVNSNNNTVIDNVIWENGEDGITTTFATNSLIDGNEVYSNTWVGIRLDRSNDITISNNRIRHNSESGINFGFSSENQILNNQIHDNGWGGIQFQDSTNNIIRGNSIHDEFLGSERWGTNFAASHFNLVEDNTLYNFEFCVAFGLGSTNNQFTSNHVYDNVNGFFVGSNSDHNTISANLVENNGYGIFISSSSDGFLIENNKIIENGDGGIYLDSNDHRIEHNTFYHNNYGINLSPESFNTTVTENDFILNNENSENSQANDDGTENTFNLNFYDEWTMPDDNNDGIVDDAYEIDGPDNKRDLKPVVDPYNPDRVEFSIRERFQTTTSDVDTSSDTETTTTSETEETSDEGPGSPLPYTEVYMIAISLFAVTLFVRKRKLITK
ncbi:MAG: right-handed parallel beta-helix repeat-containing protein [Candidatus Kariarchaeaceae archaeon]|jgi:parallel beta-helix repeat protein